MDTARFRRHLPGSPHAAQLLRHCQPRLQTVFVKPSPEICATEPDPAYPLQAPEMALGAKRGGIETAVNVGSEEFYEIVVELKD